jgi:hypothetical protein
VSGERILPDSAKTLSCTTLGSSAMDSETYLDLEACAVDVELGRSASIPRNSSSSNKKMTVMTRRTAV